MFCCLLVTYCEGMSHAHVTPFKVTRYNNDTPKESILKVIIGIRKVHATVCFVSVDLTQRILHEWSFHMKYDETSHEPSASLINFI